MDYGVALEALKELAAPFNVNVTRPWVAKYVRIGLLPPQRAPGLGRGKGRQNLYSGTLAQQLVPLLHAIEQYGKNLGAVGWHLWWNGYYANPTYWHDKLVGTAATWNTVKAAFPITEAAETANENLITTISADLSDRKDAGRLVGAIKRHAADQLQDFLEIMVSILNGSYVPLNSNSQDEYSRERLDGLFSKSLSIPVTGAEIPNDNKHFPTNVSDFDEMLSIIARFAEIDVASFINGLSHAEIHEGRAEIATLMHFVAAIEQEATKQTGKSAGAKPILWLNADATGQASALIGWLLMRRDPTMRSNIAGLNKLIVQQIELAKAARNAR